jgi:septum site-determining protein MinD
MAKTISIHSFRRGTGKSTLAANLAVLLAVEGQRVGVMDTDIPTPSLHLLFGLDEAELTCTLNDYLLGSQDIEQAAHDIMPRLGVKAQGHLFLIPASTNAGQIARVLHKDYDAELLTLGLERLSKELALDVLMIDTHAGLNQDSLLTLAMSDELAIVLRLDKQDYQGTAVTVEVARRLEVSSLSLIVNMAPAGFDPVQVSAQVEQTYGCLVSAVLPLSDEMMTLSNSGIFVLDYAHHPMTHLLKQIAARWIAQGQ